MNMPEPPKTGDIVYFWTARGSHGYARVREIKGELYLLDPEPDATQGRDYRRRADPARDRWHPRDHGVYLAQIDTAPRMLFAENF